MPNGDRLYANISLNHNYLYDDFAYLIIITDELLSKQPDLFDRVKK